MAKSASHPISTRDSNISLRAKGSGVRMGCDTCFTMYCCFYYMFEFRNLIFIFTLKKLTNIISLSSNRVFLMFKCIVPSSILKMFRSCRHSFDFTYAQKRRIRSEVIWIKSTKVFRKDVIKSEIKGDGTGSVIKADATVHIRDAKKTVL